MNLSTILSSDRNDDLQVLWEDGDRVFCRWIWRGDADHSVAMVVLPVAEHPAPAVLDRFAHEYALRDELDAAWAAKPLELIREAGRTALVVQDTGGEPLDRSLVGPMETGVFLRVAISITGALGKLHQRGLVHKDIKPANILVNNSAREVKFTGFGIASRLPREQRAPDPPETIAGTLAYMAPEQTGRMNRSIDSRSDLYALGVTFYQMLTGGLPFDAVDPMEWVHCHLARRPAAPAEQQKTIPEVVSAIVMKLLSKWAEDRYQTAAGLERDLRRCQIEWEKNRRIDDFPIGEHDTPDRLTIPEKLYGREREVETLLAAFDRVVKSGIPEFVLVSGYSGIGKSSVVNELQPVLVPTRGLFASGKFDQYKRDIPYSTVAQAFRGLIRPLLSKSEADLAPWRDTLQEALGPNAALIADIVPELKLVIGEPPPVDQLSPQDAQRRFQMVFRRFLAAFARPEQPLALFLDDLQWLDAATLHLIEDILTQKEERHVLLVGAYRDNVVTSAHPLMRMLERIRSAKVPVHDIVLAPLAPEHAAELIADALYCEQERAAPLAKLVHEKTAGNPFFVIQFLTTLVDEGLLTFDHTAALWLWDPDRIHAKGYTDNVVELMVGRISRLPHRTREFLERLACMGNRAEIASMAIVSDNPGELHDVLREALETELVLVSEGSCRFLHDRVQEAAYSLIPALQRTETHLRIGRLLVKTTPREKREEAIFEIVNQLNRGASLVSSQEEREQLAELNLIAGKRAKAAAAYASALNYLAVGAELLSDDGQRKQPDLSFSLQLYQAECEFLTGKLEAAEARLIALSSRATDPVHGASIACLRMDLYTTLDRSERAVEVCLDYLRQLGIDWQPHPTDERVQWEYQRISSLIGRRQIEELVDLPLMTDPKSVATLDVLVKAFAPASFMDTNLYCLIVLHMVNLSLEHGNADASCEAYTQIARFNGPRFGNYKDGFRFARLGNDLAERRGLKRFQARARLCYAIYSATSTSDPRTARDLLYEAFDLANAGGEFPYATFALHHLISNLLAVGDPLVQVRESAERALEFARKARFGVMIDIFSTNLAFVRMLQGQTTSFGSLGGEQLDERQLERQFADDPRLVFAAYWYWARKLQARFLAGDYGAAIDASSNVQRLIWMATSFLCRLDVHFYCALSHAAAFDAAPPAQRDEHFHALTTNYRQLEELAENCSEIFKSRAVLVSAEIARIEGRQLDAERLYESAIKTARVNQFVNNEALANERASYFYAARGFDTIARAYLREARFGYLRWGAEGKIKQLEALHPFLHEGISAHTAVSTTATRLEQLDFATAAHVSQSVASEIVLERLIDTLLRTAIEQAGAERGLLIIPRGAEPRIAAEAMTEGNRIIVHQRDEAIAEGLLPVSVLQYVLRTGENVIVDDAATQATFSADPYIRRHKARSILCLPLLNQAKLIGVLLLENHLAPGVFSPAQITVLRLVSSQAAIALENSRLYGDLKEREAKIRRLVDANIIGILIFDFEGQIIEANDAFLGMVGYEREDLVSGRMRWTDLTPPEWRESDMDRVEEVKFTGTLRPFEKEYFRKDGARVPVLVGVARYEETRSQGVAFVIDLTERKRAESEARESERRFQAIQMELAHASRVVTMGQLTASIAHEVNQPITAMIGNAEAALRWLARDPPDLEETRQLLARIATDGRRASNVVGRIRDLTRKAPPRMDRVAINGAVSEVIELARGEAMKNGVSIRAQFADGLPLIEADRIQLQQVTLNLIVNAIQAMSEDTKNGGEVSVSTSMNGADSLIVSVRDTGPGVSPESLTRLFDPFYTTKPDGMGMGLSICQSIIENHRGRIWATANVPQGAAFHFTIPTARR